MSDTITNEIYTSIEDLPLDDYEEDSDHDDSVHADGNGSIDVLPRTLMLASKPLVKYVPFNRELKQRMVGKDVLAMKRALSHAGFGKWGAWGDVPSYFGRFAKRNLMNFQEGHNLKVTGVYNKATHQKLAGDFDDYGRWLMGQAPKKADPYQIIVNTAMYGYTKRSAIHYTQGWLRMEGVKNRLIPPAYPHWEDCSSFSTWCYWVAKLPDPNGMGYNGFGYTGTQINNGRRISVTQLRLGDLVFYGRYGITHVAIYVGHGRVVSHGSESGPLLLSTFYRSDLQYARTYH